MQGEARWLAEALQRAHYSKVSVEKVDRKEFLETYMNRLDRQRLYFLESDHEGYLKTFLPTIGTYLEQGNLFPGFRIYNDYKSKALVRLAWVIARLQNDFDFNALLLNFLHENLGKCKGVIALYLDIKSDSVRKNLRNGFIELL